MPTSAPFLIFLLYRESLFLLQSMPTSGSGREVSVFPSLATCFATFATFQRAGTNMNMNPFAPLVVTLRSLVLAYADDSTPCFRGSLTYP